LGEGETKEGRRADRVFWFCVWLQGGLVNDHASDWVFKQTVKRALDYEMKRILTTDGETSFLSNTLDRSRADRDASPFPPEVVTLEISLKHHLLNYNAQLGFFRPPLDSPSSSISRLPSSFKEALDSLSTLKGVQQTSIASLAAVKAYFDWSKGWFSPYLMASQRTPAIPRQEKLTA